MATVSDPQPCWRFGGTPTIGVPRHPTTRHGCFGEASNIARSARVAERDRCLSGQLSAARPARRDADLLVGVCGVGSGSHLRWAARAAAHRLTAIRRRGRQRTCPLTGSGPRARTTKASASAAPRRPRANRCRRRAVGGPLPPRCSVRRARQSVRVGGRLSA